MRRKALVLLWNVGVKSLNFQITCALVILWNSVEMDSCSDNTDTAGGSGDSGGSGDVDETSV